MLSDVRLAFGTLLRRPGYSAAAILTLAVAIGATTAIFNALYQVLLRPMPFDGGDRLVHGWVQQKGGGMMLVPQNIEIEAWRKARSVESLASYSSGELVLAGSPDPEFVAAGYLSLQVPDVLRVRPILGRMFTAGELVPNGRPVVLLSEGAWRRRFGARRDVLGETIELGDSRREIVGVMPGVLGAFRGVNRQAEFWLPYIPPQDDPRSNVILRLREGLDIETATAELAVLSRPYDNVDSSGEWVPKLTRPADLLDRNVRQGLPILFAAVVAVLLIACANVASLLLLRLLSRSREIAIRVALGASRRSVLQLLAVESAVLVALAGGLGLLLAVWLTELIRVVVPDSLEALSGLELQRASIGFAPGSAAVVALLFALVPVLGTLPREFAGTLLARAGSGSRATASFRLRGMLVSAQIGLCLVLLIGSLLLIRSVLKLRASDLGFRNDGVLAMTISLPRERYPQAAQRSAFFHQILPALQRVPGVAAVATATSLPLTPAIATANLDIADRSLRPEEKTRLIYFGHTSPSYLDVTGIRLAEGTFFNETARDGVAVINRGWAVRLWPGQSAVGKRLRLSPQGDWLTVIGVIHDVALTGPRADPTRPLLLVPQQYASGTTLLAVQTNDRDYGALVSRLRTTLRAHDATLLTRDAWTIERALDDAIALDRFFMQLLSAFGALALLISLLGLYGVISNAVAQRTRELGVRIALGASPRAVQTLVLRQGMLLISSGIIVGMLVALNLVRLLSNVIYGVLPRDPFSFALAPALLAAAALAATWLPARRAVRADPLSALRAE